MFRIYTSCYSIFINAIIKSHKFHENNMVLDSFAARANENDKRVENLSPKRVILWWLLKTAVKCYNQIHLSCICVPKGSFVFIRHHLNTIFRYKTYNILIHLKCITYVIWGILDVLFKYFSKSFEVLYIYVVAPCT